MKKLVCMYTFIALIMIFHEASATTIQCPKMIKTNQSMHNKIKGWDAFVDDWNSGHYSNGITFYADHPNKHAALAPDNENESSSAWNFGEEDHWIACGYSGTTIQIIQKLPKGTKHCEVNYSKYQKSHLSFTKIIANCI